MENIMKTGKFDKEFDGIKWAINARSNDPTRENINCVKIEMGLVIATDSHRLHIAVTEKDLANGVYNVIRATKDMIVLEKSDLDFPDYERVFPVETHNGIPDLCVPDGKDKNLHATVVLNHVLRHSQNRFDVKQILDACPPDEYLHFGQSMTADVCPPDEYLHFGQSMTADESNPLVIRNQDCTKVALVMPLRDK